MNTYAVHVIVKVEAESAADAENKAMDAINCIPESVLDQLDDDPYALKTEEA